MKTFIKEYWPVISTIGIYWATIVILLTISINMNQGLLIYPLDDTYIHMAIAKNTVQYGVWGVTKYEFTSSTSSPLWTFLLVITYLIFGVNEISPLALTLLFGTLLILTLHLWLKKYISSQLTIFAVLLIALFVTPLPSLTFTGMEHILHTLLTLCFVYSYIATLSPTTGRQNYVLLIVLAPLVTMTRFEGIFLVFIVCILLVLQRRAIYAGILGAIALSPVVVYGIWSISKGWYFLPNSVLLKGQTPSFTFKGIAKLGLGYDLILRILNNTHILFLLILALLLLLYYLKKEGLHNTKKIAIIIFVGVTMLHMQFARTGWFYRYEAYLVFLGIAILGTAIDDILPKTFAWKISKEVLPHYVLGAILIALVVSPFVLRAYTALKIIPYATNNIYEQQYQMGLFLAKFYQGETVAVNDIGAVTYLADIRLLDLWGLGSLEPARLRIQKCYKTDSIYNLARKMDTTLSIVYDKWFEKERIGGLPTQWIKVGQWKVLSNNVVLGDDTVSFYAVNPLASDRLIQNLKVFETEMPVDVNTFMPSVLTSILRFK